MSKVTFLGTCALAASFLIAIPPESRAGNPIGFADDFSTSPLTNGKWINLYRDANDGADALLWDQQNERFTLAKGAPAFTLVAGSTGSMTANYSLPDSGWTAEFDYTFGGGTVPGGWSASDGLLIRFNSTDGTVSGNPVPIGYFVFLDSFQNGWDPASGFVGLYY